MSMKIVCNRCNKVKEDRESFNRIRYICSEPELLNEEYDLCPECSKLFRMFLDGGEVEEDHYKDSKPRAIVIHKLAGGHYGIENDLRIAKEFAEAGKLENLEEEIVRLPDMDKEESDLSVKTHKVTCPTTGETVTVPDSKPWSSSERHNCGTCNYYGLRKRSLEPCKSCSCLSNWTPKKDKTERCFG